MKRVCVCVWVRVCVSVWLSVVCGKASWKMQMIYFAAFQTCGRSSRGLSTTVEPVTPQVYYASEDITIEMMSHDLFASVFALLWFRCLAPVLLKTGSKINQITIFPSKEIFCGILLFGQRRGCESNLENVNFVPKHFCFSSMNWTLFSISIIFSLFSFLSENHVVFSINWTRRQ